MDYVVAYFLMSMLFYTVFAFKDIIVNIFGLTQAFHLTVVISQQEDGLEPMESNTSGDKPRRSVGSY